MRALLRPWATRAGLMVLALVLLWPLPAVFSTHVLAAPDQEAATHIWGLWAALETRSPLVIETDLLSFPDGVTLVLVDPANLPWFAAGLPFGPAAAYNLTLLAGVLGMGVAGWLLAQRVGGQPILGAVVAMACPTLLANAADGMTEGFGVCWVGIQLALLLRWRDSGRRRDLLAAGGALAVACYTGPYNGVWCALLDGAVGGWAVLRARHVGTKPALRLVGAATLGAVLVAPLAWAIATARPEHLPGSLTRAGLPPIAPKPDIFRGGVQTGADLLDPWLPLPMTGGEAPVSHTAYLGFAVLGLGLWAVLRRRTLWPWALGVVTMALLSLGPYLYLRGVPVEVAGRPTLGPAGLAMLALPPLARLTRWYRAGAVATLLLAPMVSTLPRRAGLAAALVVVLDVLLLAPLAWPLHHTPLPDAAAFEALPDEGPGAILEFPPVTSATPPPQQWRDQVGVLQPQVGRPVGGAIMGLPVSRDARRAQVAIEAWLREGQMSAPKAARLRDSGFRWLAIYPPYRRMPGDAPARLAACLGPPVGRTEAAWVYDLSAIPEEGCGRGTVQAPAAQPR